MVSNSERTLISHSLTTNQSRCVAVGHTDFNLLKRFFHPCIFLLSFVLSPEHALVDGMTHYSRQKNVFFFIMYFKLHWILKNFK